MWLSTLVLLFSIYSMCVASTSSKKPFPCLTSIQVFHFYAGVSSSASFTWFGIFTGILLIIFGVIWPKGVGKNSTENHPTEATEPSTNKTIDQTSDGIIHDDEKQDKVVTLDTAVTPSPNEQHGTPLGVLEAMPFLSIIKTPEYFLFLLFHLSNIMWITYYPSTVQQRLLFFDPSAASDGTFRLP